jgi:hypothetical protein
MAAFPVLNSLAGHGYETSPETFKFIAARMLGDGTISRDQLEAELVRAPFRREPLLARYDRIRAKEINPANGFVSRESTATAAFLHDPMSPLAPWKPDLWLPPLPEVIVRALQRRPVYAAAAILQGTLRLLCEPEITLYLEQPSQLGPILGRALKKPFPEDYRRYTQGAQANGNLHLHFWNALILGAYWISVLLYLPLLVILVRSRAENPARRAAIWIGVFMAGFVVLHAIVVYTLSGDFPRYQERMSWLIVLGAAAMVCAIIPVRPRRKELGIAEVEESLITETIGR